MISSCALCAEHQIDIYCLNFVIQLTYSKAETLVYQKYHKTVKFIFFPQTHYSTNGSFRLTTLDKFAIFHYSEF